MMRPLQAALLPALLASLLLVAGCNRGGSAPAPKQRPPPLVAVAPVQVREVPVEVRAPVDLRPLLSAEVGSKTLGYLDAVLVDRGDRVKRGQLLAVVRPSDLPDQLAAARSSLAQAQSQSALAHTNLERATALAPQGVVSQQELQQAEAAERTNQASEASAKAQLAALATRLGETRIESPLDGVISVRRLDPGALVGPATGTILTVVRTDVLRVFVAVNERSAADLKLGLDAHVEVDALPGRTFTGKVVRLAPAFDPVTRTLDAEIHLANPPEPDHPTGLLRPGMYGRGAIVLRTHPGAVVAPVEAVQISENKYYAFVLMPGDKVARVPVEVGVDGGEWLEITHGLQPGQEVVVAGVEALADGSAVRVARSGQQQQAAPPSAPPAAQAPSQARRD